MHRRWLVCCALLTASCLLAAASAAERRFLTIGTGGVTGVYYPAGGAIAQVIATDRREHRIRATVESTGGSVYNINAVLSGDLELGLAQSDRQYDAYYGQGEWAEAGAQKKLRAVFSLHPEIITLVAATDAGIATVADLAGKRVNLGNPGSGHLANARLVLSAHGLDPDSDLSAEGLKAAEAPRMLQDGRIDAFFYTVGHPSGAIKEATNGRRQVRLVPITGMLAVIAEKPFYEAVSLDPAHYPQAANTEPVASIGLLTTVVASSDTDAELIYVLCKEVVKHLDRLKAMHPALAGLTPAGLVKGHSAPLHDGAKRFFSEAGLLQE